MFVVALFYHASLCADIWDVTVVMIYKIISRQEWVAAQSSGQFDGSDIDRRDGYIHFSTAKQVRETALLHFRGKPDLIVLEVPSEALGAAIVWEPSRGGDLFPHLYGPLALDLVAAVYDAALGADGVPTLNFLA
jgi:uncharacterized protein (DUF952 family)